MQSSDWPHDSGPGSPYYKVPKPHHCAAFLSNSKRIFIKSTKPQIGKMTIYCLSFFLRRGAVAIIVCTSVSYTCLASDPVEPEFSDWTLACRTVERVAVEDCSVVQSIEAEDDASAWSDIMVAYGPKYQRLIRVALPHNVDLSKGMAIGVDGKQVGFIGYKACTSEVCLAEGSLSEQAWRSLYLGKTGSVVFHAAADKVFSQSFSLPGLEKAVAAMASRVGRKQANVVAMALVGAEWDNTYLVRKGDTLSSIAVRLGIDVNELRRVNGISNPAEIEAGAALKIPIASAQLKTTSAQRFTGVTIGDQRRVAALASRSSSDAYEDLAKPDRSEIKLRRPVVGRVIGAFGKRADGANSDGINIEAPLGTAIVAAADGTVMYAANEIKGYGNLILIRHDNGWVTAYGHIGTMLVSTAQRVIQGQIIGRVGKTGTVSQPQLVFELRQAARPVDPVRYLQDD